MINPTTYFYGDLAEYTGKSEKLYGGLFYEIRILEGHKQGDLKFTQRAPISFEEK